MGPIRRTLFVVTFAILLVASLASLSPVGAQEADAPASNTTITVSASGTVTAPPEIAVINLAVVDTNRSAQAAAAAVGDSVTRLRERLTAANISDEAARTTSFTIQPVEDENGTVRYRAVHRLELRVPADDAGSVVDTAIAGGATEVDGVQFTLSPETREALRTQALQSALSAARTDAAAIADAIGVEVRSVQSVSTSGDGEGPISVEATRTGTTFEPGPVSVTASVTVTYRAQ